MHLQSIHGNTIDEINNEGFNSIIEIQGMSEGDSKLDISLGYSKIIHNFSIFWNKNYFDYVFCLGDRFEMSAAVQAGIPFEVNFVHIHGGETSLGSIDNIYRDQISLASKIHITANEIFSKRLVRLLGNKENIFSVGSLSLDGLNLSKLKDWKAVSLEYKIPLNNFVLTTFHPETVGLKNNLKYVDIIRKVLLTICNHINIIITLPNADSLGSLYRSMYQDVKKMNPNKIFLVDSFGKENYFSAMNASNFMLGNSSSGIIEAASFYKYVVNVGDRQLGRLRSDNIIDVEFDYLKIIEASKKLFDLNVFDGKNRYKKSNSANLILKNLIKIINR